MGDLSENFSRREFACRHCGALRGPDPALLRLLQLLRDRKGKPLRIVSGYRCLEHNRAVGGVAGSQHVAGWAADIPPGYATVGEAAAAVASAAAVGGVGIGSSGPWAVHLDVRRRAPARWRY